MYLKDRCNKDGQCYPAISTIEKELQLSRRTVERAIADLLTKEQRWCENGGRSSLLYTLKKCSLKSQNADKGQVCLHGDVCVCHDDVCSKEFLKTEKRIM